MSDKINLTEQSAVYLSDAIATGELSPVTLLESTIAHIERVNPIVNAVVTLAFERAREEAAAAELAVSRGKQVGPLHGIPIAIKDNQLTQGIRTTYGSPLRKDLVPVADAAIVAKIRDAGGIVIGKTNIPEFSIGANTVNPLFGATTNPFNKDLTCGGSSGGSAAAVASGMVSLATGSDHGGSLRIPACFCGVVGFRASPGVVPNEERMIAQTHYSVQGGIARNVPDVALLTSVISRRSTLPVSDPMAFPLDSGQFARLSEVDPRELKVAVTADLGGVLVSDANRQLFTERLGLMQSWFKCCDWHDIDLTAAPGVDWHLRQDVFATQYSEEADQWPEDFNPNVKATFDSAIQTPMLDIAKARGRQITLMRQMSELFSDYDLLILPGMSIPPFPWRDLNPQHIDGKPVENYMAWLALTSSLTVVGNPVVTLPAGLDGQGTPFGIQVVGPMYDDHHLLSAAASIEVLMQQNAQLRRPIARF